MASINAIYVSVWDGGLKLESPCKINTNTRRITGIKKFHDVDVEVLDEEYVEVNGVKYRAGRKEELESNLETEYVFWYK